MFIFLRSSFVLSALLLLVSSASNAAEARRIVSLAPHITENLFSIGAGDRIVGTVSHSDYPMAAMQIPRIGDASQVNLEALYKLKPDLVISWRQGIADKQLMRIRQLGISVLVINSNSFEDIADNLRTFGQHTGLQVQADEIASQMLQRYQRLQNLYSQKRPLRLFYQLWHQPLMTVNRSQMLHQLMTLCGAVNPFADQRAAIPRLGVEAVIAARPEVIATSLEDWRDTAWTQRWQRWQMIPAVANNAFITLDADITFRATLRALEGAEQLCVALDKFR